MHYFNLSLLDVYEIRSKCREIGEASPEVKCYRMMMIMMLDIDSKCKLDEGGSCLRYYTSWIICLSFPSLRRAVFLTWVLMNLLPLSVLTIPTEWIRLVLNLSLQCHIYRQTRLMWWLSENIGTVFVRI